MRSVETQIINRNMKIFVLGGQFLISSHIISRQNPTSIKYPIIIFDKVRLTPK